MSGWKSQLFEKCIEKVTYTRKIQRKDFLDNGRYPIVSQEYAFINGYWDDGNDLFKVDRPVIIFGDHTKVLKYINFDFVLGADGVKILKPKEFIEPRFFYYQLQTAELDSLGYARHYKLLKELDIRYPDIPEQQRIVAILDEAFVGIATATANAEKNLQNARELFESTLQSVFAEKGEGWKKFQVKDVASHCLGKMLDKNKNKGEFKPYLRNLNVRWFDFNLDDMLEMRFLPDETERYTAIKGDLMVCEGGYPGRAAIWEKDEPAYFQKAIHRVRFEQPEYAKWLLYFLYLSDANGDLRKYFTGAGIQHFTGKALGSVVFPMPPLSETRAKLSLLDNLMQESKKLEGIYEQKLHELEGLKQSILQKAFAGELH